jgi:hypothetical protein
MPLPRLLPLTAMLLGPLALAACQDATGRIAANNAALSAGYPFDNHRECDGEVARQLQQAGIAAEAVESISYINQTELVGGESEVVGFDANVRLRDKPGLLVVDVEDEACFTRQVYTRSGLEVPGLPAF